MSVMQQVPCWCSVGGWLEIDTLTVQVLDENCGKVNTGCIFTTSGQPPSAESIFNKIAHVLSLHHIPWDCCVGLGVDNASANIGSIVQLYPNVCMMVCPCHTTHNIMVCPCPIPHTIQVIIQVIMQACFST